jgi:hypothetical protein
VGRSQQECGRDAGDSMSGAMGSWEGGITNDEPSGCASTLASERGAGYRFKLLMLVAKRLGDV